VIRALAAALLLVLPPQDEIRGLIEKLRSDSAPERGEAERRLRERGPAAIPELEKAAKDADAEVAGRAQRLLRLIPLAGIVTPRLRTAMPGVEERLASDDPHAWTEIFLAASQDPKLRRPDLEPLAGRAVRAASGPEETAAVLEIVAKRRLKAAAPDTAARLKDPDGRLRKEAIETLFELRAKEAIPDLAACLKDPNHGVREEALVAIWRLGRDDALPLLLPVFKDPSPDVKLRAMDWLSEASGPGIVEAFQRLLDDKESPGVVAKAAEALGVRRVAGAIPRIRTLLDHPDGSVRSAAVKALGAQLDRKELVAMVRFVADDDVVMRRAAIDVLRARRCREAIPELRKLLAHGNGEVRRAAIVALRQLGAWEATGDLAALLRDPDPDVRDAVPQALAELRARVAVPALVDGLADPRLRLQAVKALGELGSAEAVPGLFRCLKDGEARVPEAALQSILLLQAEEVAEEIGRFDLDHRVAWSDLMEMLQPRKLVPDLLQRAASSEPKSKERAMIALQALEAPESTPALLGLVRSGSFTHRLWALTWLDARRSKEEAALLLKLLEDPDLQAEAALGAVHLEGAAAILVKLLASPDASVRMRALQGLEKLRAREALPQILARLDDDDENVRELAVSALRATGAKETVPTLEALLGGDPDEVRGEAVEALAEMGAPSAEAAALRLLDDPVWHVRTSAARALAALGTPGAKAGIQKLFRDEVEEVRQWALWVFGDLAGKDDVPGVAALLADRQAGVRAAACDVLARIGVSEAGPMIVPRLGDRSEFVRCHAVEALVGLGVKGALPSVAPLLGDPAGIVRERAVWAVTLFEGADRIAPLLADEAPGVRRTAADAIGARGSEKAAAFLRHEWAEARVAACRALGAMGKGADEIRPLLRDADFEVRAAAAEAMGLLRSGESDVAALLEDREPRVRAAAASALGAMGSKRPELAKRLADVRSEVRIAALRAVGEGAALKLVADGHRDVRAAAVEVLGRAGKKDALLPLLSDPSDLVRKAAGAWLCRMGDRTGFAEALRGEEVFALNAVREPKAWSALDRTKLREAFEGTPRELAERLAREAGLQLEWGSTPLSLQSPWRPPFLRLSAGTTALDALPAVAGPSHAVVLEGSRLRVLPLRQATSLLGP
jgi:HEAT repeat protein